MLLKTAKSDRIVDRIEFEDEVKIAHFKHFLRFSSICNETVEPACICQPIGI